MQEEKHTNTPEDFDLVAEFNAGGDEAFNRIVEKHSGPLINFLYHYTRNQSVSEDIAQEAFLRLYKTMPNLQPKAKLSTILHKIAYNLAIDQARRNKSRSTGVSIGSLDALVEVAGEPEDRGSAPDELYEAARRASEMAACLAELPDSQRTALILKVYEDRSYSEIAEIMNVSVSSVESLLFRGRRSLAEKVRDKSLSIGGP